jgi:hypothetical protein
MEASAPRVEDAPWKSIVLSLVRSSSRSPEETLSAPVTTPKVTPDSEYMNLRHAQVDVLERATTSTAIISWNDPTRCSYRFQLWRRSESTRAGVCALSGVLINVGDSVYRPSMRPPPLNASAMILATQIESRLGEEALEQR